MAPRAPAASTAGADPVRAEDHVAVAELSSSDHLRSA